MRGSIFVGHDDLMSAHRRVGRVVDAFAQLEEALSYLEWQLTAYTWDVENPSSSPGARQTALRAQCGQ